MSRQSEIRISNLINAGLGEIKKAVNPHRYRLTALFVARLEGFEPPASSLGVQKAEYHSLHRSIL